MQWQAQHLAMYPLRKGDLQLIPFPVCALKMRGQRVMDHRFDTLICKELLKFIAFVAAHDKQMPHMLLLARRRRRQYDPGIPDTSQVKMRDTPANIIVAVETLEFNTQHGRTVI